MGNFQFEVPEIISEKLSRGDEGENSSHRDESERLEKEAVFFFLAGLGVLMGGSEEVH